MSDPATIARGARAFNELEEVGAAFETVKQALLTELAQTPLGQEPKVLNLHKALQNLAAVRLALQNVIDSGKLASAMQGREALAVTGLNRPN
jgi:hypothetical protein